MAPCTHPGMKRLFCPKGKKRPRSLRSFGFASLLVERCMRQSGLVLAADRVRSKEKNEQKNGKKSRPLENTPQNPHQPSDRDHLETACDETRPTRSPTLARFHGSQVCGIRPRTALAISKTLNVTQTLDRYTDGQTDGQTNLIMAPCTHPDTVER